jgi:hypothetical protein
VGPGDGPTIRMTGYSPAPAPAAFSNSSRPTLPGDSCWAATPEPKTTAAKNGLPRTSAAGRRQSTASVKSCRSLQATLGASWMRDGAWLARPRAVWRRRGDGRRKTVPKHRALIEPRDHGPRVTERNRYPHQ